MNLYYSQFFIIVMWVKTSTSEPLDLKACLDNKVDKLAYSESIADIMALVQEQSNLILKLAETVDSQK